ncbi:hypothetical protein GGS20DRAFT_139448 [Poronia punctata]|nr:hypothetical protein GGS20DRAFT_139448 [Poronia punctata]
MNQTPSEISVMYNLYILVSPACSPAIPALGQPWPNSVTGEPSSISTGLGTGKGVFFFAPGVGGSITGMGYQLLNQNLD